MGDKVIIKYGLTNKFETTIFDNLQALVSKIDTWEPKKGDEPCRN